MRKIKKFVFVFVTLSIVFNIRSIAKEKPFLIELELQKKFGGLDVPSEQILANPCDMVITSEGLIYILDSEDNDIKVFKKDGTFLKCFGRTGQGPGEFSRPWSLSFVDGKIYVTDTKNRRVQIFSKEGEYLRSYKVPVEYGRGMSFDEKGNIYLNTKGFRSSKLISAYDTQGNLLNEFGDLEGESIEYYDFTQIKKQILEGRIPSSFKNDLLLIHDHQENLMAVHRALNKLKIYSPSGTLQDEVEIEADEYLNIYKEFLKKNKADTRQGTYWGLIYINDLAIDKFGNLYLLLNVPSCMTVYVYSNEGKFRGKLLGVKDSIFRIDISDDNSLFGMSQETQFIYQFPLEIK